MKKILFCAALLMGTLVFTACSDDDNNGAPEMVTVTNGLFILNEGSYYSHIDGSLSYLDYSTQELTNGVFAAKNGRSLGGTPNDAIIYGTKMYIASTDEGRVEVIDATTLESLDYTPLTQPRKLVGEGGYVYVTSYEGTVSRIDTTTYEIVETSEVIGANLEGITALNGFLYVCNAWNNDYTYNTNVVKLDAATLDKVSDITVVTNPTRILNDGTNVYVQSTGDYGEVVPTIQKIDANDEVTTHCNGLYMALYNGKLYHVPTTTDANYVTLGSYEIYDLATGENTTFTEGDEIFSPAGIAVDPNTGIVYISSFRESVYGGVDYSGASYVVAYNSDGTMLQQYEAGVNPSTFVFQTSSHRKE